MQPKALPVSVDTLFSDTATVAWQFFGKFLRKPEKSSKYTQHWTGNVTMKPRIFSFFLVQSPEKSRKFFLKIIKVRMFTNYRKLLSLCTVFVLYDPNFFAWAILKRIFACEYDQLCLRELRKNKISPYMALNLQFFRLTAVCLSLDSNLKQLLLTSMLRMRFNS